MFRIISGAPSMAEIVLSLLGPLIQLGKCLVAPVKSQFNYLCCFNNNVLSFKDEAKKLGNAKNDLDDKVTHEKNNGKEIVSGVTGWLRDYSDMETKVGEIEANISNVQSGCLAIKSRYALSKKVKKATKDMKELRDGCRFDGISRSPPPPSMVPAPLGEANEFPSRKQIEEDVMQALRHKNVPMMGMCGMGGLGKTTMAKKVMHRVRDDQLFDEVLMVVVSKDIDKLNIQQELAELLGLSLGVETLQARAYKLRTRLTGNKRTLIVVDDIWSAFDLVELGIPCESGGTSNCTILLTSRSQNVLKKMNAVVFSMDVLSKEEAWSLFKSKVGDFVEEKNLEAIAKKVADECNGLPLALAILGSSLKDKTEIGIWEDTLRQLKDSNLKKIPEFLETIYPSLRLSYEKSNDSDARRLFLFCSQFPEDSNISLNDLAMFSMSLRLFGRISNVEETRHRLSTVVDQLESRSLLLDGMRENSVKMHDVVRDVANVIAREEGLVNGDHQGSDSVVECQWMFMFPNTWDELRYYPLGSSYPSLRLLAIQKRKRWDRPLIIKSFSSMDEMKELWSLSLDSISIKSLPQAIQYMRNLKMLHLVKCNLKCISIVGQLLGLEILVCRQCEKIKELPLEIQGLNQLKLLEFQECRNLKKIAPGMISNLTELEELIMWGSFTGWESKRAKEEETSNASLQELELLTKLKLLWIHIEEVGLVEHKLILPKSIVNYKILVGKQHWQRAPGITKSLSLYGLPQQIICQDWVQKLVSTTQDLYLKGNGSTNFDMAQLCGNIVSLKIKDNERVEELADWRTSDDVFPLLKSLELKNLPNLNKIYEGTISFNNLVSLDLVSLPMLTSLWKIPNQNASSLDNLRRIRIWYCNKLRNLFPMERAKNVFLQLKEVHIHRCEMMEEVFYNDENGKEGTNSYHTIFPKLEELTLSDLPSLTTFAKGIESIEFPLLRELDMSDCPKLTLHSNDQKVAFGSLKKLAVSGDTFRNIWCSETSHASFGQLEDLTIIRGSSEDIIRSLNSSSISQEFLNLKHLRIAKCIAMEKVIGSEIFFENFPALEYLELRDLPKLEEICDITVSVGSNALHNLKTLGLYDLPALKHMWSSSNQWSLLDNLCKFSIISCKMMEHVFSNKKNGKHSHITFSNMKSFQLHTLTRLETMFDGVESIDFPELKYMYIERCPNLISIVPSTDGDHSFHLIVCPKVAFPSLEELKIEGCDNISNIWSPQIPPVGSFEKLKELRIKQCGGIKILFTSQIAENLINLEELYIRDCQQMEKVMGDLGEVVHGNYKLFPSLVQLKLGELPSLKMFCEWDCSIVLPFLRSIDISSCPRMEVLTPASLIATNLVDINLDGIENTEWNETEDLNGYIRQHIATTAKESTSNEITEEEEEEKISK